MKKRILSMLLVLIMVIGMIPLAVSAEAPETVYISVSFDGNYLTAGTGTNKGKPMAYLPVTMKLLKTVKLSTYGLADYAYDADGDGTDEITVLHLFVYAHEKIWGTKWKNNVNVSGEAGNLTIQGGLFGFAANMAYNLNGTVNATSIDRIVLQGGDFMDIAGYTSGDYSSVPSAGFRYFVDTLGKITHKYTGKLNNPTTVSLIPAAANKVFYSRTLLDPNAKTVTTDADGKAAVTPDSCGTWYVWSLGDGVSAPAYTEIFVPWENTNNTTAYWSNFRNSQYNMAITDAKTPVSAATTVEKWTVSKGTSWTDTPSGMIIADNALIFMGQTTITKADLQTGEVLATNKMSSNAGFAIISPTFGDGLIFCPLSGGKIEAFNAKTLESVWVFTDALGGQNNTPITYHDGYVYTGYWNGENKEGNFVCVNASTGELVWSKTTLGGHYWSGSTVVGNAVIVGTDDGARGWEGDSHLYALNRLTGEVISDITLSGMGDQRSTIAYSTEKGRVYFTTKNGYIASAAVNATTGALSDLKSSKISSQATATPVIYGDKIYVGAGGGMQVGATAGNLFAVDANTLEYLYEVPLKGYPQGSILISTAYLAETGKLYCYATYNNQPGGMTLIKIDPNATTADGAQLEEIYDATNHPQYCLISPICGPDGTIYYRNDSGTLIALTINNAYLTGMTSSVGTFTQEFAPGRHNYELVVPVGTQSVTLTPAACEGGAAEAVTVSLDNGTATANMTVTKGSESRTYAVSVRTVSTNASLGSLKVNQTNSYGGTISPDFAADEHYYTYLTAGSNRSFMNVWPDAADRHATLKVYLMDNAAGQNASAITEDGSLKVTATNQGHSRYAVYFADGDKPMAVRIEVTSENGEVDNYYVVISKEAAAEDGKALLEKIKADKAVADKAAADTVIEKITAIGTVTLDSRTTIEAARTAYNALTVSQRTLVNNYNTLTTAEASLKALQDAADKAVADQAAADVVTEKIAAIGTVTLDSKTPIKEARTAYDALTAEQKALVTNYAVLTAAEERLEVVKDEATANPVKIYVTLSNKGNVVLFQQNITVTDVNNNGFFDVDDALYAAHEVGYTGGAAAGYASEVTQYGLGISKLWGDTSYCYGYWLNNASCWSLEDVVAEGNHLVAFVYTDSTNWSDAYTKFEKFDYAATAGKTLTLKLDKAGYDANWNTVFSAHAGANIAVYDSNGQALTGGYTVAYSEDGSYSITLSAIGNYYVVATDTAPLTVPAVCAVAVNEDLDKKAADAVTEKIAAIGTVTKDSKAAIEAARTAYNALTAEQKALVANYNVLTTAEKTLSSIISGNPATGDNTNIMLYSTIMLVSLMGIAALLLTSKKKYKN